MKKLMKMFNTYKTINKLLNIKNTISKNKFLKTFRAGEAYDEEKNKDY